MSNDKKSFFYNPSFRVSVYILAWTFLWCFKLLTLLNTKWERIIDRYEEGHIPSTAIIAFTSGLIIEIVFFLFTYSSINWSAGKAMILTLIYLLMGLMGLLSLIKFQDYEKEKDLGRR